MLATVVGATVGVTGCITGATALFIRNGLERHRALVPEKKATDVTDQVILPNGRRFGYFVPDNFDPARKTIVSIHGTPESAVSLLHLGNIPEYAKLQAQLAERDVQTIAIDRWGVGLSQFHDGPVADIASDVDALCDHLGVSKFMVGGASGAGPYMSACAALLDPQRCVGVDMDVPMGPRDLPFHLASDNAVATLFNRAAWQTALIATIQKEVLPRTTEAQFVKSIEGLPGLCENDVEAVRRDVDAFVLGLKDSKYYQHGIAAHVQEYRSTT
jgi:pimeloyl-ACP methyl ester carboxylesterase